MKTIKFFSFVVLVSLAWVACKKAEATTTETTTPTTTETTAALTDEVLAANKSTTIQNLVQLQTALDARVSALQEGHAAATGDAKLAIANQLATMQKYQAELATMLGKVNDATIETWSTVANEVEALHATIKSTQMSPNPGKQGGSLVN